MLQPMSTWFWFSENSQLMLSMGDEWQCTTAFGNKQIVNMPANKMLFSLRDTESYLSLSNQIQQSAIGYSDAQLTHVLINATAALQFHRPVTPKSWFFDEVDNYGVNNRLANLTNQYGIAVVLVLTQEQHLCTCMLISPQIQISDSKALNKFELIKVANNRLEPFLAGQYAQLTA